LRGCTHPGKICYLTPTENSERAYLTAREESIFPSEVPNSAGVGEGIDITFHPAGISPNVINGVYISERAARNDGSSNWLQPQAGQEALEIMASWIKDALEGIDFPHGPYAQLYILIFAPNLIGDWNNVAVEIIRSGSSYGIASQFLKGALSGECTWEVCVDLFFVDVCFCGWGPFDTNAEEEWVSNMYLSYTKGAYIHIWEEIGDNDSEEERARKSNIHLALRESDGGNGGGGFTFGFFRDDDFCGFEGINKEATKRPDGLWVPLYKYEFSCDDCGDNIEELARRGNYHRTNQISAYLLVRTVTVQ
jgi:hypothetical protein